MRGEEPWDDRRDVALAEDRRRADSQRSADVPSEARDGVFGLGNVCEDAQGMRIERRAGLRERDSTGRTRQKSHAEVLLETRDSLADRRRGRVEGSRRGGKRPRFNDSGEHRQSLENPIVASRERVSRHPEDCRKPLAESTMSLMQAVSSAKVFCSRHLHRGPMALANRRDAGAAQPGDGSDCPGLGDVSADGADKALAGSAGYGVQRNGTVSSRRNSVSRARSRCSRSSPSSSVRSP